MQGFVYRIKEYTSLFIDFTYYLGDVNDQIKWRGHPLWRIWVWSSIAS